jgi:hypothetical protein
MSDPSYYTSTSYDPEFINVDMSLKKESFRKAHTDGNDEIIGNFLMMSDFILSKSEREQIARSIAELAKEDDDFKRTHGRQSRWGRVSLGTVVGEGISEKNSKSFKRRHVTDISRVEQRGGEDVDVVIVRETRGKRGLSYQVAKGETTMIVVPHVVKDKNGKPNFKNGKVVEVQPPKFDILYFNTDGKLAGFASSVERKDLTKSKELMGTPGFAGRTARRLVPNLVHEFKFEGSQLDPKWLDAQLKDMNRGPTVSKSGAQVERGGAGGGDLGPKYIYMDYDSEIETLATGGLESSLETETVNEFDIRTASRDDPYSQGESVLISTDPVEEPEDLTLATEALGIRDSTRSGAATGSEIEMEEIASSSRSGSGSDAPPPPPSAARLRESLSSGGSSHSRTDSRSRSPTPTPTTPTRPGGGREGGGVGI